MPALQNSLQWLIFINFKWLKTLLEQQRERDTCHFSVDFNKQFLFYVDFQLIYIPELDKYL